MPFLPDIAIFPVFDTHWIQISILKKGRVAAACSKRMTLRISPPDLFTGLTPLTLAAAMAHKDMYNHIIEKEREVFWVYGDVTCAAYPLENIDSIHNDGTINSESALHIIIHGDKVRDYLFFRIVLFEHKNDVRHSYSWQKVPIQGI